MAKSKATKLRKDIMGWVECNDKAQVATVVPGVNEWLRYTEKCIVTGSGNFRPWEDKAFDSVRTRIVPGMKPSKERALWDDLSIQCQEACASCGSPTFVHEFETYLEWVEEYGERTGSHPDWTFVKNGLEKLPKDIEHHFYPMPPIRPEPGVHWMFIECVRVSVPKYRLLDQTMGTPRWDDPQKVAHRANVATDLAGPKGLIPMMYCYGSTANDWPEQDVLSQAKSWGSDVTIPYPGQVNFYPAAGLVFGGKA